MRRLAPLFLLLLALAGCGDADGSGSGKPTLVATTTQVGDMARNVAGPRMDVHVMLRAGVDPHDYEPRPSDAREIAEAALVVRSGGEVDEWLGDLLGEAGERAERVDLSEAVEPRGEDPHWWQDPRNAIRAVEALRAALAEADPDNADAYDRAAAEYTTQLEALDADIARCVERIPQAQRKLVTTHDALGHYARRYGFEVVGALIPSLSTQAQPSAGEIDALVGQIRREKVRAIFPESGLNPKLERAVSRETGARVGGELYADTLAKSGPQATYIGAMRANTGTIVAGLTGMPCS